MSSCLLIFVEPLYSDTRQAELRALCLGEPYPPSPTDPEGTANIGLIIGLVLAGVALIVVVLIVVCYMRRRKAST